MRRRAHLTDDNYCSAMRICFVCSHCDFRCMQSKERAEYMYKSFVHRISVVLSTICESLTSICSVRLLGIIYCRGNPHALQNQTTFQILLLERFGMAIPINVHTCRFGPHIYTQKTMHVRR